MDRVIAYVDGFNLYFGLRDSQLHHCRWLDIQALANNLLLPAQQLVITKYFTARISEPEDKRRRQTIYIEALETLKEFHIYYGKYQSLSQTCYFCGHTRTQRNEKMTDVNIAVELLSDAFQDRFDTAILISADSDLTAPLQAIRSLFPKKRVIAAFPPKRYSHDLARVCHKSFVIKEQRVTRSLLPLIVYKTNGFELHCPKEWR